MLKKNLKGGYSTLYRRVENILDVVLINQFYLNNERVKRNPLNELRMRMSSGFVMESGDTGVPALYLMTLLYSI
ncbi:hypothetical protein [uncultured Clostridium sp.]|uniref:hypothetical protein n=1 Tax=uncultured Clostridium sp. TaxID=59620 RepID=UPI0025FBCDCF|nr:hypothetical protein [uncultured Clostridium sp.]